MRVKLLGWIFAVATLVLLLAAMPGLDPAALGPPQLAAQGAALQATADPSGSPTPDLRLTPAALGPDAVPERRPSLVFGGVMVVAVILFGLALRGRRS